MVFRLFHDKAKRWPRGLRSKVGCFSLFISRRGVGPFVVPVFLLEKKILFGVIDSVNHLRSW